MAGQTPRFNLNFFGGDTPGDFDDDTDKYTGEDRLTIDRLLAALENHDHHLTTSIAEPSEELHLDVVPGGGTLAGGETYHYVVSYVDKDGLETVAGPEASIDTPDLLATPDDAQGETVTGGSLAPGQYYFALSALGDNGEESALGDPSAVTVLNDAERSVLLTLPDLGDANRLQIWRQKDDDPGWTRVGTSITTTFTDDGSVPAGLFGDPDNEVPLTPTGSDTNAITIALTGQDLIDVQLVSSWRIYRSEVSGVYSSESLVHEVVEHASDLDPTTALLSTWTDDGDALLTGSPKIFTQTLNIPPFTFEAATPLPDAAGYPDYYPIVDTSSSALYMAKTGAWQPLAGSTGPTGPSGPSGPVGATGASGPPGSGGGGGGAAGTFLWSDTVTYPVGVLVLFANDTGIYYAASESTNVPPDTDPASWINLGFLVPGGGTTGQILAKASDTNGAIVWIDPPGAVGGGDAS